MICVEITRSTSTKPLGGDSSQVKTATDNKKTSDGTSAETSDNHKSPIRRARSSAGDSENLSQQHSDKKKEETGADVSGDQKSPLRRSRTVAGPEGIIIFF